MLSFLCRKEKVRTGEKGAGLLSQEKQKNVGMTLRLQHNIKPDL